MHPAFVRFAALTFAVIGLVPAAIGADTLTGSKAGDFDIGQRLCSCAAFYSLASEVAAESNKPAAVEHFQNVARGWSLAGMFMLASGTTAKRFDAKFTADSISAARLTTLRAKVEAGGGDALTAMQADHERDCDPLIPLQENIIATMRQGANAPATRNK